MQIHPTFFFTGAKRGDNTNEAYERDGETLPERSSFEQRICFLSCMYTALMSHEEAVFPQWMREYQPRSIKDDSFSYSVHCVLNLCLGCLKLAHGTQKANVMIAKFSARSVVPTPPLIPSWSPSDPSNTFPSSPYLH